MEIHWRNAKELSGDVRAKAEEQLAKLAEHHRDMIDLTVDVERKSAHHKLGKRRVEIRCQARGTNLVANGEADELGLALRDALRTFRREVEKLRDRRRDARAERPAEPPLRGVIDRVERAGGFGFLITDAGERVYFHRNAVGGGLDFDRLEGGETVALNYEAGGEGLQATFVRSLEPG
jgi:ribosomal subunit interface protein